MLGEGEWNNIGPGGLNKIGACPGAFASLFQGGGGGGGGGEAEISYKLVQRGLYIVPGSGGLAGGARGGTNPPAAL